MKNTIKLDNPVQINGKSYDELTYDISEITAQAFAEADARKLERQRLQERQRGRLRPSWTTACTSTSASLPSSPSTPRSTSPTSSASAATTL